MTKWGRAGAGPMRPRAVAAAIRTAAKLAGVRASGHSLRVGAAVSMAARGASLPAMQLAGGWTAPIMPAHYARQESAKRGPVTTLRPEDRWQNEQPPPRQPATRRLAAGAQTRTAAGRRRSDATTR